MQETDYSTDQSNKYSRLEEVFTRFFRDYYKEDVAQLAQHYPKEQRSLEIEYGELYKKDHNLAEDWLENPDKMQASAENGLQLYDLPADISMNNAHVRMIDLPTSQTHYPGHFSPTKVHRDRPFIGVQGEIVASSSVYPSIVDAAFECLRCGVMMYIPQLDSEFQDPHECKGCERQGPFQINFDQSEFVDTQKLRVAEPPEVAAGEGETIDIYVEDDIAGIVTTGDRVTVNGLLCLKKRTSGAPKSNAFDHYIEGQSIEIEESDHSTIEITEEDKKQIRPIANGEHGDPLELAAKSIAAGVFGEEFDHIKRALVLAVVGGEWITHADGEIDRGSINVLVVGDPGTAKSKLIKQAQNNSPRAVGVSGKGARTAGITASAVRDDFSEGEWTLKAGAFVKANGGVLRVDELDDMPEDVRAAMLEPMANGEINVSKAGINATLETRTSVVAAANPKYSRFDRYEPVAEQVGLDPALISRFDLSYVVTDDNNPDTDQPIGRKIVARREFAKQKDVDPESVDPDVEEDFEPPVNSELLRKWIALAKRQPAPVMSEKELGNEVADHFVDFRSKHSSDDAPIPATWRRLEAKLRIAEAAAKLELSPTIERRHVKTAISLVMRSMKDFGMNEDGQFDADVVETGTSKPQRDRITAIENVVEELCQEAGGPVDRSDVLDEVEELGFDRQRVDKGINKLISKIGSMYAPTDEQLQWLGRVQ